MKSLLKSIGNNFLGPASLVALWLVACQMADKREASAPSAQVRDELKGEISLKADRSELERLRQDIPKEKQQANDEIALITPLLSEVKAKPSDLQSRFQTLVQKRRSAFTKKVSKLREDYHREETKRREIFMREQQAKREDFKKSKTNREKNKEFYAEQDRLRSDFFANERDRRKDFEAEIQAQSKDFDSNMRERQKEFGEQLRLYSQRYQQVEKEKREAKSKSPPQSVEQLHSGDESE